MRVPGARGLRREGDADCATGVGRDGRATIVGLSEVSWIHTRDRNAPHHVQYPCPFILQRHLEWSAGGADSLVPESEALRT